MHLSSRKSVISNSGPLIHLAKTGLLILIKRYDVKIPTEVKHEVVDKGKEKGFSDAILIEKAIEDGMITVIDVEVNKKFYKAATIVGLHEAEIPVIFHAYSKKLMAFLDDDAARVFARGIGIKVRGSFGLLIEGVKNEIISRSDALKGLDKLSQIMYLSSNVYRLVLKQIE